MIIGQQAQAAKHGGSGPVKTTSVLTVLIFSFAVGSSVLAQDAQLGLVQDAGETATGNAEDDMSVNADANDVSDMSDPADASLPNNNAPRNWTCDSQWYEDGVCDCGCTVPDPDCPRGFFRYLRT